MRFSHSLNCLHRGDVKGGRGVSQIPCSFVGGQWACPVVSLLSSYPHSQGGWSGSRGHLPLVPGRFPPCGPSGGSVSQNMPGGSGRERVRTTPGGVTDSSVLQNYFGRDHEDSNKERGPNDGRGDVLRLFLWVHPQLMPSADGQRKERGDTRI